MTIDEVIKICEEDAEKIGGNPQSDRHAERCRQIAEWLRELKEVKRILRLALEDMNGNNICNEINACAVCTGGKCTICDAFRWRYTDEAEKLLGEN